VKRIAVLATALMALTVPVWGNYDTGWYAYTAGDFVLAHGEWLPLAKDGDARAQYQLGVMYQRGEGVDADTTEAVSWYSLVAEQGYAPSKISLARMSYTGIGVAHDHDKAAQLAEHTAKFGNTEAQFFLGALYHRGHGVHVDLIKSHMWLSLAAMRGSKLARERLAVVKSLMTKAEIATAEDMRQELVDGN
jgi:TPR repeat protein